MTITPDDPEEVAIVERLRLDWILFGEVHVTNGPDGHSLTRLDPAGIIYTRTGEEMTA